MKSIFSIANLTDSKQAANQTYGCPRPRFRACPIQSNTSVVWLQTKMEKTDWSYLSPFSRKIQTDFRVRKKRTSVIDSMFLLLVLQPKSANKICLTFLKVVEGYTALTSRSTDSL